MKVTPVEASSPLGPAQRQADTKATRNPYQTKNPLHQEGSLRVQRATTDGCESMRLPANTYVWVRCFYSYVQGRTL